MYVPGSDWKKIGKIQTLTADSYILDCEDGVAMNKKEEARVNIARVLNENIVDFGKSECSVRVNSVDSGLCEIDLESIFSGPNLPKTLHLPKVESTQQLDWLASKLSKLVPPDEKINLIIFVESARSLLDMKELCQHGQILEKQGAPFILDGAVFGSDDFCADIGATRTTEASELMYARQHFVTVAKAFRLQAIDLVHIDFKDMEGLMRQSAEGARMGYTGKQVIHPIQIEVVQNAFTPSKEKIEWARQLVDAFDAHQMTGQGAFTFRGHMIDMPLLLQAKNVLQTARLTKL